MTEPEPGKSGNRTEGAVALSTRATAALDVGMGKRAIATIILGAHTIQHIYVNGFYVIVPQIYKQLGLVPLEAGIIDASRWISSGLGGILAGFTVDLYRHRRGFFLGLSLIMLAGGYLLVSLAPSYILILLSLFFAHIGAAMWHPPGIGLLSEAFPKQRGLLISLHRSTGSAGDTIGPVLVGIILTVITWQQALQYGFAPALILTIFVWWMLWNVGGQKPESAHLNVNGKQLMASLKRASKGSGLILLLIVSALRGMGDKAVLLFFPLYLSSVLEFSTIRIGLYVGLLTLLAIGSGPVFGAISDRIGRKPLIVVAMLISAIFPPFMVLSGDSVVMIASVVLFGLFLYSVNSLAQAAAMDIAEGMKLEGTFIGMLWGNNALFGAISPVIAGALVGAFGFQAAFYYASTIYLVGGILSLFVSLKKDPAAIQIQ